MDAGATYAPAHVNGMEVLAAQAQQRCAPILPRPRSPQPPQLPPPPLVDQRLAPAFSDASGESVTPDEVLTLGVLALAGLWPGAWSGIAAIIIKQVDRLAQKGAADVSFRRCAMSLVEMLLKTPGDPTVAVETWRHLAAAQARLPDDLSQVLGLACSLLQSRTMEAADLRLRKKRRRTSSADTIATLTSPPPRLTPPCAAALVVMVSDMGREEEEARQETEIRAEREAQERNEKLQQEALASISPAEPQQLQQPLQMPLASGSGLGQPHGQNLPQLPPLVQPEDIQNGAAPWGIGGGGGAGAGSLELAGPSASGGAYPILMPVPQSQRQYDWNAGGNSHVEYYTPHPRSPAYPAAGHFIQHR